MLVSSESLTGNEVDNGTSYSRLRSETGTRLLPVSTFHQSNLSTYLSPSNQLPIIHKISKRAQRNSLAHAQVFVCRVLAAHCYTQQLSQQSRVGSSSKNEDRTFIIVSRERSVDLRAFKCSDPRVAPPNRKYMMLLFPYPRPVLVIS